jgi:hypothetical protein
VTYPAALPAGTAYWKYGPTPSNSAAHWYSLAAAIINGNTASFSVTDGGEGDADLTANGVIRDPGGPGHSNGSGQTPTPGPGPPAQGPLLSVDHAVYGRGALTRDTTSGLDWLDLTFSASRSYSEVVRALANREYGGFRYATEAEVRQLWATAGIQLGDTPANVGPFNDFTSLLAGGYLAADLPGSGGSLFSSMFGLTGTPVEGLNAQRIAIIQLNQTTRSGLATFGSYLPGAVANNVGSYLVRATPQ